MAIGDNFTFVKPNFGNNPANFFREVTVELRKVSWPKRPEIIKLTAVVIGVSALVALYLGGLDFVFGKVIELILARK